MTAATTTTTAPGVSLADVAGVLRRRWRPMAIACAIVLPIVAAAALLWPATYRSTATILIEQQEVPTDLVRSTISSFADQRLQVINQRVMTSANLLKIIDKYGLYEEERSRKPREVILDQMRESVRLRMISADVVDPRRGGAVKATIAFTLSFDHESAEMASRVANELVTLYLNENIETRKQLTAETATFLSDEAERLGRTMTELDGQLVAFRQRNAEALRINPQLTARLEEELRTVDARLFSLDQQLVYLDSQLAQVPRVTMSTGERVPSPEDRLKAVRSQYIRASAVYSPDHPDVDRLKREMEALEQQVGEDRSGSELARQLADSQAALADARQRYGEEHPDITRLQQLVTSIEAAMRAAPQTSAAVTAQPDNPAYLSLVAQREMAENEREEAKSRRAALVGRIAEYERRLSMSPELEREYTALMRELEYSQQKYREVRQKQLEAQLSQNLEIESKGERFTLIEPPFPSEKPFSPNRPAIFAVGIVLALVIAVGLLLLLEATDGSIKGSRDLEQFLTAPALAVVPWMETEEERARQRRTRNLALIGAGCSLPLVIAAVHFMYRPLDVLLAVALRKLGG